MSLNQTYNSFSGVDIKAVLGKKVISEIQAFSVAITREKAPIYTMGSAEFRAVSRGKRGIAGSLIFVMFDKSVLVSNLGAFAASSDQTKFMGDKEEETLQDLAGVQRSGGLDQSATFAGLDADSTLIADALRTEGQTNTLLEDQVLLGAMYADQIPPFNVTLMASNEYGAAAVMRVIGCEIMSEGYGISVDDLVSEQQCAYIARSVIPWVKVNNPAGNQVGVIA